MKKWSWMFLGVMALPACTAATSSIDTRHAVANGIAERALMKENVIPSGLFELTSWERIEELAAPVTVYIEGDGLAWLNKYTPSTNPTPPDPLALRLATVDRSTNVIYLARPCQYTGWTGEGACPELYWTTGRTAPEVIASYRQALDNIKERYHTTGFNLVGYSGGAAVAVLVAAQRQDILSIRTVAGNVDYDTFTRLHSVSPLKDSIRPTTVAMKVMHIPQRHFIGGQDTVVPVEIFEGWREASGASPCVQSTRVPSNTHTSGWVETWPALLAASLACSERY